MDKPIRPIILIIGVNVLMFGYMAALALYAYIDGAPESTPPDKGLRRHTTVLRIQHAREYMHPAWTNRLLIQGKEAQ